MTTTQAEFARGTSVDAPVGSKDGVFTLIVRSSTAPILQNVEPPCPSG